MVAAIAASVAALWCNIHADSQSTVIPALRQSSSATPGCLNFLHIPKTGGSAVLDSFPGTYIGSADGSTANMTWRWVSLPSSWQRTNKRYLNTGKAKCVWGHIPPAVIGRLSELYSDCETFCVVRNPVSRMISEYFYRGGKCEVASFQKWVQKQMNATNPHRDGCHMIPQSVFVVGPNSSGGSGCRRVLRLENLQDDLHHLMSEYNLSVTLRTANVSPKCKYEVQFGKLVVPLVEQQFSEDLRMFGYGTDEPKALPKMREALAAAFAP